MISIIFTVTIGLTALMFVIEKKEGLTFVHPYDDPDVIAGQGTIAKEILDDYKKPIHAVFCCVGGGGLCAGSRAHRRARRHGLLPLGQRGRGRVGLPERLLARGRLERRRALRRGGRRARARQWQLRDGARRERARGAAERR